MKSPPETHRRLFPLLSDFLESPAHPVGCNRLKVNPLNADDSPIFILHQNCVFVEFFSNSLFGRVVEPDDKAIAGAVVKELDFHLSLKYLLICSIILVLRLSSILPARYMIILLSAVNSLVGLIKLTCPNLPSRISTSVSLTASPKSDWKPDSSEQFMLKAPHVA